MQQAHNQFSYHMRKYSGVSPGTNGKGEFKPHHKIRINISLKIIENYIKNIPNAKIIDIGSADGKITKYFLKNSKQVFGFDIDKENLKKGKSKNIFSICGDATSGLPIKSDSLDFIFAGSIIEHMYDTEFFLEEIRRCLKKNVALLITTPNISNFINRFRMMLGKYPIQSSPVLSRGMGDHIHLFNPKELKNVLDRLGYRIKILKSNCVSISLSSYKAGFFARSLAKLFPNLGDNLIVLAIKN